MSIARIAEYAGVSMSTVSRVLNQSRPVQPEIEKKVRAAIDQLRLPVRQVRRRQSAIEDQPPKTITVAIITLIQEYHAWLTDPVIGDVIAELSRKAAELDMPVMLAEMLDPDAICSVVKQGRVDGALVLIPGYSDSTAATALLQQVPAVRVMGAQIEPVMLDQVAQDDLCVGYMAADYLMGQGCKKLAFLSFAPDWAVVQMRAHGFFRSATARSRAAPVEAHAYFTPPPVPVDATYGMYAVCRPDWNDVMREFVAKKPDGLFVARDADLPEAYRLLSTFGIVPGRDITVISCDHSEAILASLPHRPASIDLCVTDIASRAIDQLLTRLKDPRAPYSRTLLRPRLVLPDDFVKLKV